MPCVLITGASTGIGRAAALRLAAADWTVYAGVRDAAAGERLASEAAPGRLIALALDVTDPEQIAAAAARIEREQSHGLDGLVNNAGVGLGGPLELIPAADLRAHFDVNLFGHVAVTQALLPALRRAHGRIVFVSSIGGRVAMGFTAPYAASKHAVEAVGDALRVELHSSGVRVALVEPGSVATPIWDKSRGEADRITVPAHLQAEYGRVPAAMDEVMRDTAKRGIAPERVAAKIEHALISERMRARYVVGRDARAMLIARRVLPDLVFDRVARRVLGV